MVFLGSILISLSTPIVVLIYGRGSFNQNAVDVVGLEPCGCPVICLGHNSPTRFKMNMNKA